MAHNGKIIERIHNLETNEIVDIERDLTPQELAELEAFEAEQSVKAQAEAQAQAKREAALEKLSALGLTADDLRALGL